MDFIMYLFPHLFNNDFNPFPTMIEIFQRVYGFKRYIKLKNKCNLS